MNDFIVAVGLVLVIEGILYAAFTDQLKAMMREILPVPNGTLRVAGIAAAVIGLGIVWLGRG